MNPPTPARAIPRLRHRPAVKDDLPECLQLLPAWVGLDAAARAAMPALWARLVDEPSVMASVTEDLARPAGSRVQSWGVGMALPVPLAGEWALDGQPRPGIARQAYAALLDGRWQPMSEREMGQDNARGDLRLLALHFDMRCKDLGDPAAQSLMVMGAESFRVGFSGYNTRAMYYENPASTEAWMTVTGFARRPHAAPLPDAPWPGGEPLMYFRLTRDEALATVPGTTLRHIFEHQPPLFKLTANQRLLLWLSLFDDHDENLMQRLNVSVHGLKKLWRGIYERVEDVAPEFFGDGAGADDGKRGPEKRRQVLAYVRQRPEEMRPWASG